MSRSVGVFAHVGNHNQGDEALVAATIQNIRARHPNAKIVGYTLNPRDSETRHGIASFPIHRAVSRGQDTSSNTAAGKLISLTPRPEVAERIKSVVRRIPVAYSAMKGIHSCFHRLANFLLELPFLFRSYHSLKGIDLLIVAGSQQCNDLAGGPWNFPFTLFKWSLLSRLTNTKVAFLSVGAGPITSRLSRFFIRQSLELASYRSFRDQESKTVVESIGVSGDLYVFPDLVYSLNLQKPSPLHDSEDFLTVGINPLPLDSPFYWIGHNAATHCEYVKTLATFAAWLLRRGHTVVLFPTQLRVDPPVIEELQNAINQALDPGSRKRPSVPRIQSFEDLISTLSTVDIAVVTRFHGVVFSYLLQTPVLGIAYHKKTQEMMETLGQSDYVTDVEHLTVDWLIERFLSMVDRRSTIAHEIETRTAPMRKSLDQQYDEVLALLHN